MQKTINQILGNRTMKYSWRVFNLALDGNDPCSTRPGQASMALLSKARNGEQK
jgi:hypothetical protein